MAAREQPRRVFDARVELDVRDPGRNRVPEGELSAVGAHAGRIERKRRKGHSAREAPSWDSASGRCQCWRGWCSSRQSCRANAEQRGAAVAARSGPLEAGHSRKCGEEYQVHPAADRVPSPGQRELGSTGYCHNHA